MFLRILPASFILEETLGYIYTVICSNIHRTKFCEFLKINFPKIIFVDNTEIFEMLNKFGTELINSHLLKVISN
ncbi:type ISP restriction/modification enzyme [Borreliella burgdorferi]|uniref:type ISP restriction/modification enzyme n=1 Tax=Borreliella burgdorferi TaxID=139 RepID=UPI00143120A5|nr:type ISP restriction/modification enzyme [Borreliella burgdorferi]